MKILRYLPGIWLPAMFLSLCLFSCKGKKTEPTVAPPIRVTVMKVKDNNLTEGRKYSGLVSSSETTGVSFSVAGTITDLYVEEGSKVSKGQLLGKVRNGEYLNAYNIAEAQLAEARDAYQRLKKLHDADALPDVKWVEIQQKLKQAENSVEMAKRTLDDAELHSPVNGTVTRKIADVGQTVMPVQPVYEIVSTNDITIDISVSENEVRDFAPGDSAFVTLDAFPDGRISGKVKQTGITADPLTRAYTVKVAIPNPEGKILPGMLGNVYFKGKEKYRDFKGYILPSQAVLLNEDNRWFVWVVNDSIAQRRFVTANQLVSDGVLIESGINPGDMVVIAGTQKIGSGSKVAPLEE